MSHIVIKPPLSVQKYGTSVTELKTSEAKRVFQKSMCTISIPSHVANLKRQRSTKTVDARRKGTLKRKRLRQITCTNKEGKFKPKLCRKKADAEREGTIKRKLSRKTADFLTSQSTQPRVAPPALKSKI